MMQPEKARTSSSTTIDKIFSEIPKRFDAKKDDFDCSKFLGKN